MARPARYNLAASEVPMPISAGSKLGSCEILSLLGAGGMGEVYRARDAKVVGEGTDLMLIENFRQP
jgi:hypothetical protein